VFLISIVSFVSTLGFSIKACEKNRAHELLKIYSKNEMIAGKLIVKETLYQT
jgi:hypothetical protein